MVSATIFGAAMTAVAAIGIVINAISAWLFASGRKGDINIRAAFAWCVAEGKWDLGMHLLDSIVPELVLRERVEIGRWANETLAALGENQHAVRAVALAVSANVALVEGRLRDAESLSRKSLALEARLGAPTTWLSRNVLALVCASGSQFEEAEEFLAELMDITVASGDPMPHAVACFDRALVASFSTDPAVPTT